MKKADLFSRVADPKGVADPETVGPISHIRTWSRGKLVGWLLDFEFSAYFVEPDEEIS